MSQVAVDVIAPRGPPLTHRQVEIMTLVAAGLTTEEIAARLFFSPTTVNKDIWVALRKLGAGNRSQGIRIALTGGFICACDAEEAEADRRVIREGSIPVAAR